MNEKYKYKRRRFKMKKENNETECMTDMSISLEVNEKDINDLVLFKNKLKGSIYMLRAKYNVPFTTILNRLELSSNRNELCQLSYSILNMENDLNRIRKIINIIKDNITIDVEEVNFIIDITLDNVERESNLIYLDTLSIKQAFDVIERRSKELINTFKEIR